PMGRAGSANAELLHFGRQHCEGLLKQGRWRLMGDEAAPAPRDVDACVVEQLTGWIERARAWRASETLPRDPTERAWGLARRQGIADDRLVRSLVEEMERDGDPREAASALWARVPAWPGHHWHHLHELD